MRDSGLEAVFLNHRASLLRFLRARGAGDAAEDLVQEMWIKAAAGASGPIADPLAYLYRTANNLLLDRRRAELRGARRDQVSSSPRRGGAERSSRASIVCGPIAGRDGFSIRRDCGSSA